VEGYPKLAERNSCGVSFSVFGHPGKQACVRPKTEKLASHLARQALAEKEALEPYSPIQLSDNLLRRFTFTQVQEYRILKFASYCVQRT
jgi:hypothetical protein